jgi:hypothetical protein
MSKDNWAKVRRATPCPVCAKPDWCLVSIALNDDGTRTVICPRTANDHPHYSALHEFVGYLHRIPEGSAIVIPDKRRPEPPPIAPDELVRLNGECRDCIDPLRLARLAQNLGLSVASLLRLRIGWHPRQMCWTFPMSCEPFAFQSITGIRTRYENTDFKGSIRGGHNGLFLPTSLSSQGPLLIEEGPTSTAALLDMGFDAIGRPFCMGGTALILSYTKTMRDRLIVVVANNDTPKSRPDGTVFYPGQEGGDKLAKELAGAGRLVKMIVPPGHKDSRDMLRAGLGRTFVETLIKNNLFYRKAA